MASIMAFAFVGTIISTFTVGGLTYLVSGVLQYVSFIRLIVVVAADMNAVGVVGVRSL